MKYRVAGGVAHVGTDMVLTLGKEQAAVRAHALERVAGGWRPRQVVQFKAGEIIGIDVAHDDLPRGLADVLVPIESRQKAQSPPPVDNTDPPPPVDNVDPPEGNGAGAPQA